MNDALSVPVSDDALRGRVVNQREIAEIIGVTQKTIWAWQKEGMPIAHISDNGLANQYNTADVIAWYCARMARKGEETPKDRLDRINGDLKEIELAEKLGKLVSVDDVEPAWTSIVLSARQAWLSFPSRVAPLLIQMSSIDAMRDLLTEQIEEILTTLSNGTNENDDNRITGEAEGACMRSLGAAEANPAVGVGGAAP
jgi:phage terminase Nu1 subunit (DNA packaging protein)